MTMRKTLIVTLALIISFTALLAQDRLIKPEMYVGVNFGATESQISFNPTVKQGYLQGYNGGLVFRYIAEKNVGTQVELNFSQRGWKESTGLYTRQLNYIELPFMTHIFIGKKNRFFFNIGPKVSYLISDKLVVDQTTTIEPQYSKIQNPFDYGLCGGLGLLFNIKGNIIQLDTRFNYSLNDIYSNKKTDFFSNSNNMNLSCNLAWLLKIK
jgi:hypothetical protein